MYFLQETLLVHKDLMKTPELDAILVALKSEGLAFTLYAQKLHTPFVYSYKVSTLLESELIYILTNS